MKKVDSKFVEYQEWNQYKILTFNDEKNQSKLIQIKFNKYFFDWVRNFIWYNNLLLFSFNRLLYLYQDIVLNFANNWT